VLFFQIKNILTDLVDGIGEKVPDCNNGLQHHQEDLQTNRRGTHLEEDKKVKSLVD